MKIYDSTGTTLIIETERKAPLAPSEFEKIVKEYQNCAVYDSANGKLVPMSSAEYFHSYRYD